jgi:N,N'-diacetyllegionaminate synthase
MKAREMESVKIGSRLIGKGQPCFIIAEAGVNHNGDIKLAKKLVNAATKAGADTVKFQTFNTEEIVTTSAAKAGYQKETTGADSAQFEMLQNLELAPGDFKKLSAYAREKGIVFLSSPFDKSSVDLLDELGVPAFRIPSGEITNSPLLKHIAHKRKPVILSTGMSTMEEIREAVDILRREGAKGIVVLHCVSSYPASPEDMNLKVMDTLQRVFGLPVGLSDHTTSIAIPVAAVALGACVIEKHLTLDKKLPGPDHQASLEPDEFTDMVRSIRDVEKALGSGVKRFTDEEMANKKAARRSLVAAVNIPAGTVITEKMLSIKRPGTGLEPRFIGSIIGKKAKKIIPSGEVIIRAKVI